MEASPTNCSVKCSPTEMALPIPRARQNIGSLIWIWSPSRVWPNSTAKIFVVLAKSIFEQKLKCEHLVRCQKIHICCVDKANIWWDDKKWFYQEMWKEIYLMCQQNICRDHKDICCVNTQQRMGNRHQLDVSLVRWRHDHCTKICKISNVSLHKSPKSSRSPMYTCFLSLGSSFCGLKTRIS